MGDKKLVFTLEIIASVPCPVVIQIKEFVHNARSDSTNSYTTCRAAEQSSVLRIQ